MSRLSEQCKRLRENLDAIEAEMRDYEESGGDPENGPDWSAEARMAWLSKVAEVYERRLKEASEILWRRLVA